MKGEAFVPKNKKVKEAVVASKKKLQNELGWDEDEGSVERRRIVILKPMFKPEDSAVSSAAHLESFCAVASVVCYPHPRCNSSNVI